MVVIVAIAQENHPDNFMQFEGANLKKYGWGVARGDKRKRSSDSEECWGEAIKRAADIEEAMKILWEDYPKIYAIHDHT